MSANAAYTVKAYTSLVDAGGAVIPLDDSTVKLVVIRSCSLPMRMLSILLYA